MSQTIETIVNKVKGAVNRVKSSLKYVSYATVMGLVSLGIADRIHSAKADAIPDLAHTWDS